MSEFVLIVPAGWSELADGQAFVDQHGEAQLLDLIQTNNLAAIEAMLQDGGYLQGNMADFRMFRDGGVFRIWYRVA